MIFDSKTTRGRILRVSAFALAAAAAGALYCLWCIKGNPGLFCPFHAITGLNCPGCGNSRAVLSFLRGHWSEGIKHNYMGIPSFLYVGWMAIGGCISYIKSGKIVLPEKPRFIHYTLLAALLIWWVVRNILRI